MRTGTPRSKSMPDLARMSRNLSATAGSSPESTISTGLLFAPLLPALIFFAARSAALFLSASAHCCLKVVTTTPRGFGTVVERHIHAGAEARPSGCRQFLIARATRRTSERGKSRSRGRRCQQACEPPTKFDMSWRLIQPAFVFAPGRVPAQPGLSLPVMVSRPGIKRRSSCERPCAQPATLSARSATSRPAHLAHPGRPP